MIAAVLFFVVPPPKKVRSEPTVKGRHMRRVRHGVNGARLPLYEWIVEWYGPYVLVRCAGFTNSRRHAQEIGMYTLATTCVLAGELDHLEPLGILVDLMVDVIGPDVVLRREPAVPWDDELLITDERMRNLAEGLNLLARPVREILVLHHLVAMQPAELAKLLHSPAVDIAARINRAESLLAECLTGLHANGEAPALPDVRSLLADFAAALDTAWLQAVADCAISYLARREGQPTSPHGPCHLN